MREPTLAALLTRIEILERHVERLEESMAYSMPIRIGKLECRVSELEHNTTIAYAQIFNQYLARIETSKEDQA